MRQSLCILAFLLCWHGAVHVKHATATDGAFARGSAHYRAENWQGAANEFQRYLTVHDTDPAPEPLARFLLGEALVQLRQPAEASQQFQLFLEVAPEHEMAPTALFRIGEALLLTGRTAEASDTLGDFHARYPEHPLASYALPYLGDLAFKRGDRDAAQRWYQTLLDRFPASSLASEARLQLGVLAYHAGQFSDAADTFLELRDNLDGNALQTSAGYWLGMTQMAQRRFEDAAATLDITANRDPLHPLAAASRYQCGQAWRQLGRTQEAIEQFDRVLRQWPTGDSAAKSLLGKMEIAAETGRDDHVELLAARFQQQFPDSPLQHLTQRTVARALLHRQQYVRAAAILEDLTDEHLHAAPRNRRARSWEGEAPAEPETKPDSTAQPEPRPPGFTKSDLGIQQRSDADWDWYLLSLAYLGQRRYDDALRTIQRVEPDDTPSELIDGARVARASALLGLERFAEAVVPFRQYLQSRPDGPDATKCRAELAAALAHLHQFDEAKQLLDTLQFATSSEDAVLWSTLEVAQVAFDEQNLTIARPLFSSLARPENKRDLLASGLLGLASCHLAESKTDEAIAVLDELLNRLDDHPRAPEAALLRAELLQRKKEYSTALNAFRLVIDRYPDSAQVADALLGAGQLCGRVGHRQDALPLLLQLVNEHPDFARMDAALYLLAWTQADLGHSEEAQQAFGRINLEHSATQFWADATYRLADYEASHANFERARELLQDIIDRDSDPDVQPHALYRFGQIAGLQRNWNDVGPPLRRLLDGYPDSPLSLGAKYWIAEAHYWLGQHDRAEPLLQDIRDHSQGRDDQWLAMVPLRRAQIHAAGGRWSEAYDLAASIAARYPDFQQQHVADYVMGRCQAAQGQFTKARQKYLQVIQSPVGGQSETAAMARWMIGETYLHQKQYDQAVRQYLQVESDYAFPQWSAGGLLQAATCRELQGRRAEAMKLYTRLLSQYPESDFAQQATSRLQSTTLREQTATTRAVRPTP